MVIKLNFLIDESILTRITECRKHDFDINNVYDTIFEDFSESELIATVHDENNNWNDNRKENNYYIGGGHHDRYIQIYIPYFCDFYTVVRYKSRINGDLRNDINFIVFHNNIDIERAKVHNAVVKFFSQMKECERISRCRELGIQNTKYWNSIEEKEIIEEE